MNNLEALNHILRLVKTSDYHDGYEWTVEYSNELRAYFAGVDLDKYMKRFARRESPELFEQAKQITAEVQSALGLMLEKPVAKLDRSNWKKIVTAGNKSDQFNDVVNSFGKKGLFDYSFNRLRYWNIYDPNCFMVVEFKDFDNQKETARPYPFEATSEMVIDFKYMQSDLLYLVVKTEIEIDEVGTYRYTMYRPNQTVILQELTPEQAKIAIRQYGAPQKDKPFLDESQVLVSVGETYYQAIIPKPHNYPKTPAVRTGFIDNPEDDGETKLSLFHAAKPFAKKLLKINREIDLTSALLANPIPIRYADRCENMRCNEGKIIGTDQICGTCKGTGKKQRPTSAHEEIVVNMPEDGEDVQIKLSEMFAYVHFPPEAAQYLIERWKENFEFANLALYNSELTTKSEVAQTARFHSRAEQGVNDALWPFGQHVADFCLDASKIISAFSPIQGGEAYPIIPENLFFGTEYDAFDKLKAARDSGASTEVTAMLQMQALEIMLQDDPEGLKRAKVDDYFNPFRGMSESQIVVALASPLIPDDKKIFYLNRTDIIENLLNSNPKFYDLSPKEQKDLINEEVQKLKVGIGISTPNLDLGGSGKDVLGKVPLALQQLALARERARDANDSELQRKLGNKMDELLAQI